MGLLTDINAVAGNPTERKNPGADPGQNNFYNPNAQPAQQAGPAPAPGKITKEEAEATGKTDAHNLTSTVEFIRSCIILGREYYSMTEAEKDRLDAISSKDPATLSPQDVALLQKATKLEAKFEKKRQSVKTPPEVVQDLRESFTLYAEITGRKSSPGTVLFASITRFAMNCIISDLMT